MSVLKAVTIIVAMGYVEPYALNNLDLNAFKRLIKRLFKKFAPEADGLFVIDVSFNIVTHSNESEYFQIEFHGIVRNMSPEHWSSMREQIRKRGGKRSLYIEDVYEPMGQLAYMAKPNFNRKKRYIDDKGSKRIRDKPLTLVQELLINEWLNDYSAESRIIEIGNFGDENEK